MLMKKMIRDMLSNKGSYLACLLLITLGLMIFMGFSIANDNLQLGKDTLYEEQTFAHGFAEVESMLKRDVANLADIEGVDKVSGRLVKEVRVYEEDQEESVYLRLFSQNLDDPKRINNYMVENGRELEEGEKFALLDGSFFSENELQRGDELEVIHGGQLQEITVGGVGLSPEIVYLIQSADQIYPDPERFGAGLLSLETMWEIIPEMEGRVNDLVFTLEPGADYHRVEEKLEQELEPYGLIEIYPREDHYSHFILVEEIEVIELMGTFLPILFLGVAGFIIFILLKRLVEQQRTHIGILKALGYNNREILFHYLSFSLTLAIVGGFLGCLLGMWMANPLSEMLYEFFMLPEIYAGFSLSYLFLGMLLAVLVLSFAGYQGCKAALQLSPAEAMQPPAPPSGRKTILEKLTFFTRMLTVQGKMAIRNLGRSRSRSAFMFLGIAISCAIVIFTWSLAFEAMPAFLFHQYEYVETYEARINFTDPLPRRSAIQEVKSLPQARRVEPLTELPVNLSYRWRDEDVALLGLDRDSRLYNILDADGNRLTPPTDGVIIAERIADNLEVQEGDLLEIDSPYFNDKTHVEVVKIIPQYIGMNAFMEISAVDELARQEPFTTSLMVEGSHDTEQGEDIAAALNDHYGESENVAGIDGWESLTQTLYDMMESEGAIMRLFVVIGLIFSFTIIYISSFIILSERNRELASMRVLGMTSQEVLSVITFEQWFLSIFAVIAGIPLAQMIQEAFAQEMTTDMYAFPPSMSIESILIGVLATAASIWVAQRFALYKVKQLDLVEVLKSRE